MFTVIGRADAETAAAPWAPGPAGVALEIAPDAAGGALPASTDGGTGGPTNAGFAPPVATELEEVVVVVVVVVAVAVGRPDLRPAFASPGAGTVPGLAGAGVWAGTAFVGAGVAGFGGVATMLGLPVAGGADAALGAFVTVTAAGVDMLDRATAAGATAGAGAATGAFGLVTGAETGGASGGCHAWTPRDTGVTEVATGADPGVFEFAFGAAAAAGAFAVWLAGVTMAGFATGRAFILVGGTCAGVGGSSGLVAGETDGISLATRAES